MYMEKKSGERGQKLRSRLSGRRGCDLDTDKRLSEQGSIPAAAAASVYVVALNVWPCVIRSLLLFIFGVLQRPLYFTCACLCCLKKTVQN